MTFKIAFRFDPASLLPSLPQTKFAEAFEESIKISSERFNVLILVVWKIKKLLNIGSKKRLRIVVSEAQEFVKNIIREKKHELREKASLDSIDLLSRFFSSCHLDENFVNDIVISFILVGRDTTSLALTWYLWLLPKNLHVETGVLKEVKEKSEAPVNNKVKDMAYTHASLCESMWLYLTVSADTKEQ
jgi:cytochrome P450